MTWNYVKSALLWGLGLFAILLVLDLITWSNPLETHGSIIRAITLYVLFLPIAFICDVVSWIKARRRESAYRRVRGALDPSDLVRLDR